MGGADEGSLLLPGVLAPSESFSVDSVRDFGFPAIPSAVTLSGRVTDSGGSGVANASVNVTSDIIDGVADGLFSASVNTDALGNYSILVLSGLQYSVTVLPEIPVPGGFPIPQD